MTIKDGLRLSARVQATAERLIGKNAELTDVITRTLNEMFEYGQEFEQDRIISILDDHRLVWHDSSIHDSRKSCTCGVELPGGIEEHRLALIEGVTK